MLSRLSKRRDEEGFTLIELLVVIIIIGILAAIAIPVFLGQRTNAYEAAGESNVRNAAIAMESYYLENDTYADADNAALVALGYNGGAVTVVGPDVDSYCLWFDTEGSGVSKEWTGGSAGTGLDNGQCA